MVTRMTGPRAVSATELAREVSVPQPTLSRWLRESATFLTMHADETSPAPAPATNTDPLPDPPAAHRGTSTVNSSAPLPTDFPDDPKYLYSPAFTEE